MQGDKIKVIEDTKEESEEGTEVRRIRKKKSSISTSPVNLDRQNSQRVLEAHNAKGKSKTNRKVNKEIK